MKLAIGIIGITLLSSCKLGSSNSETLADPGSGGGNCNYDNAAANNGWGWDPVAQSGDNCRPRDGSAGSTAGSKCNYDNAAANNGWGWDPEAKSGDNCRPRSGSGGVGGEYDKVSSVFCTSDHPTDIAVNDMESYFSHIDNMRLGETKVKTSSDTLKIGFNFKAGDVSAGSQVTLDFKIDRKISSDVVWAQHYPNDDKASYGTHTFFVQGADGRQMLNTMVDSRDRFVLKCMYEVSVSASQEVLTQLEFLGSGGESKEGYLHTLLASKPYYGQGRPGDDQNAIDDYCHNTYMNSDKSSVEGTITQQIASKFVAITPKRDEGHCWQSPTGFYCP